MTGFEVVGLALAIFPLVIEGLKFYAEEKGLVKDFLRYRHVLKRLIQDLSREQTSFHNSCQRFMEDIAAQCGLGQDEIAMMMHNPQDPRWSEADMLATIASDSLKRRSVEAYLDAVNVMNEELAKIQELAGLSEDAQPDLIDKHTRRRQWRKIILVLKKDDIATHLDRAGRLNMFLAQLTQQNQTSIETRRCRRGTRHYNRIRAHAIDLHEIFQVKFPIGCKCGLQHDVSMRLEYRSAQMTNRGLCFRTIFSFKNTPSRTWREMELEPWEKNQHLCHEAKAHRQVTFIMEPESSSSSGPVGAEISNLCETIITPVRSNEWLGYIAHCRGRQHRIRALDYYQPTIDMRLALLEDVLDDPSFRLKDRYRLGLQLASSVMQLHSTQWLTDQWSKKDILFVRFCDGTTDFRHPFVRCSFGEPAISLSHLSLSDPSKSGLGTIPCLFSLGVVLLELFYRQKFEDMKLADETILPEPFSNIATAKRLANSLDCSANYAKAVKRCIGGIDAAFSSLEEEQFRNEVDEKIVLPLEEDLKFYCDKKVVEECI